MENISVATYYAPERRFLQPLWDLRIGYEDWLMSPLFPVILTAVVYFCQCLPFFLADVYCCNHKWYLKYKLHPEKQVTFAQFCDTLTHTFWNNVLLIMPTAMAQWVWTPPTPIDELAPTVFDFIWQQVAGVFMFDFQYFVWHWLHHNVRFLYRAVHSVHHRYHSPFAWVTQYLHPWELILVGLITTTNTWFFKSHALTTWSYMVLMSAMSVEDHIGFDFPFLPHRWFPFGLVGGSPKHDMHHQNPHTNYQPFLNHLDRFFGTFCPPMSGGGIKSKALQDWERKQKETKKQS